MVKGFAGLGLNAGDVKGKKTLILKTDGDAYRRTAREALKGANLTIARSLNEARK